MKPMKKRVAKKTKEKSENSFPCLELYHKGKCPGDEKIEKYSSAVSFFLFPAKK